MAEQHPAADLAQAPSYVSINVSAVNNFDPHGDAASVFQRWERWLRSFELFAAATGCADDKQKRQLLLHSAGQDTQDIFFTFEDQPDGYQASADALSQYFRPSKNLPYQRHLFRQAKQNDGESVAQFVTRLRQLAKDCDYGVNTNDFIRDQVIDKCISEKLRTRLLAEKDLTLERCLSLAASKEISEMQSQLISGERGVFAVSDRAHRGSGRGRGAPRGAPRAAACGGARPNNDVTCGRCGRSGHRSSECRCSRNVTCDICFQQGHFSHMCRNRGKNGNQNRPPQPQQRQQQQQGQRGRGRGARRKNQRLNFVENEQRVDESSDSDDYAYAITPSPNEMTVLIEDEPINVIIDSGASINILNSKAASTLKKRGVEFEECKRTLHPYGSPPITAKRRATMEVNVAGRTPVKAEFLVLPGTQPSLLCKKTSEDLELLKIGINHVTGSLFDQYPGIDVGIGQLKNHEVHIHVDRSVPPVARKHSRIPFHLRKAVENELEKLEKEDIIERVSAQSTEWVSRIIAVPKPKRENEIRLCVDMRDANRAITRTRHVTPTIEEIIHDLNGATIFSKIDLKSGYHQLVLSEESRGITTFSTHAGLFRYKRLSFGISSAAEIFQHTIQTVIADVHGTKNVSDDIIIYGKTVEEHDRNLHNLLRTLHSAGLTVNKSKCEFHKSEIEFYGFVFSADGMKPAPAKVNDLKNADEPKNSAELRSFLGMAQYSSRFIPNFATLTAPLRRLTRQDVPWCWGEEEARALNAVKQTLCESATLAYFDTKKRSELIVDASPVGVGALLSQDGKPICYASRALSPVEQRYSQTEREALGIVWACEHFDIYVRGTDFTVVTDHKPLTTIWLKPNPPARIARWSLRLQPYKMKVVYQPGKDNPADFLSRHPTASKLSNRAQKVAEDYVHFLANTNTPSAITLDDVRTATAADQHLRQISELIQSGRWYECPPDMPADIFKAFKNVKDSISMNASLDIMLKGTQIVIPASLQAKVIQLAHEGHQGINKTKSLLRSKVWFPGMNTMAENAVRECIPCQANTTRINMEPLSMSELPPGAWLNLSIDFCGPLPSGDSLLVIQDEYSRYPVVEIMRKTTTDNLIQTVDKVFAEFGLPKVIKSDNGPQFRSSPWSTFLKQSGVKHRKITPLWPRANAQAESFNKPLLKAIRSASIQNKSWKRELQTFLRMYRCTPHATTGFTPYYLLFGREPRTKLPQTVPASSIDDDDKLRTRDKEAKIRMKTTMDQRHHAKPNAISSGDTVLVRQPKLNKLSTPFWPKPLLVTATKGSMITALRPDGSKVTRNAALFRKLPNSVQPAPSEDEDDSEDEDVDIARTAASARAAAPIIARSSAAPIVARSSAPPGPLGSGQTKSPKPPPSTSPHPTPSAQPTIPNTPPLPPKQLPPKAQTPVRTSKRSGRKPRYLDDYVQ